MKPRIAVVALLLCLLAEAGHAQSSFQFGVSTHVGLGRSSFQNTNAAISLAGLTFRDEVTWSRIELQQGSLAFPAMLKDVDALVTRTAEQGRRPLLILDYGNKFYDAEELITSDAGIAAYARYVRFMVKYFKGRVDQFEIWNEWNIGMGSPTMPRKPGTPQAYVKLLKAAYAAAKEENPAAVIIGGAVAGIDDTWINAFGSAGGFQYLDAFSVHPYEFWRNRTTRPAAPLIEKVSKTALRVGDFVLSSAFGAAAFQPIAGTPEAAIAKLDALKTRIDAMAAKNVKVYITEMGWPTSDDRYGVSEGVAAAYAQRFFLLARTRPWIAGVWWYGLFDNGADGGDKENRFGLMKIDGAAKPAYRSLLAIRKMLEAPSAPSVTLAADGQVTLQGTLADGKEFAVLWLATDDFVRRQSSSDATAAIAKGLRLSTQDAASTTDTILSATPKLFLRD